MILNFTRVRYAIARTCIEYTHTHVNTHSKTHILCTHKQTHLYTHAHTHKHTQTRTHKHTHMHTHANTHMQTHTHKHTHTHSVEDFMDVEDRSDIGFAPQRVSAKEAFEGNDTEANTHRNTQSVIETGVLKGAQLPDLVVAHDNTIGVQLLKLMGWKEGQGVCDTDFV